MTTKEIEKLVGREVAAVLHGGVSRDKPLQPCYRCVVESVGPRDLTDATWGQRSWMRKQTVKLRPIERVYYGGKIEPYEGKDDAYYVEPRQVMMTWENRVKFAEAHEAAKRAAHEKRERLAARNAPRVERINARQIDMGLYTTGSTGTAVPLVLFTIDPRTGGVLGRLPIGEVEAMCDRVGKRVTDLIERVERDLHEPDKLLCATQSAKRVLPGGSA